MPGSLQPFVSLGAQSCTNRCHTETMSGKPYWNSICRKAASTFFSGQSKLQPEVIGEASLDDGEREEDDAPSWVAGERHLVGALLSPFAGCRWLVTKTRLPGILGNERFLRMHGNGTCPLPRRF